MTGYLVYWTCVTCNYRRINAYGVAQHRAMHRRRGDGPVVMRNRTHEITYDYRPQEQIDE